MKLSALLLCTTLCFTATLSFAQPGFQPYGHLTIFSEGGDKFYLILNGERQNNVPQTNLRVEELPQPYYNARIIFADTTIPSISKNFLPLQEAGEGALMDVTYKIRTDKKGNRKLAYFSAIPVVPDFIPPANVYRVHYGGVPFGAVNTVVPGGSTVGASVNINGQPVGVSVTIPDRGTATTVTTTTSGSSYQSSSYGTSGGRDGRGRDERGGRPGGGRPVVIIPGYSGAIGCDGYPMDASSFQSAKAAIGESSFDETRLSTAKAIADGNCLTADQVSGICRLMTFEANKLEFAKYAYPHTVDIGNYFKVNSVFTFEASKQELNAFTRR